MMSLDADIYGFFAHYHLHKCLQTLAFLLSYSLRKICADLLLAYNSLKLVKICSSYFL